MQNFSETKIAIIGAGMVGSTVAYAIMLKNLASELILIDVDEEREKGEVMDLSHGLFGTETSRVSGGDFADCKMADIVLITAGSHQKPEQTRLDLAKKNVSILEKIIESIGEFNKETVVILVSNPVDILTTVAINQINLPKSQVLGTGTFLDTARMRYFISKELNVYFKNVHGYVLGEHGDSSFIAWSTLAVSGKIAKELFTGEQMQEIENMTHKAAYEIIQRKHSTYYGIGVVAAELVEAVLQDQKSVIPVSTIPGKSYGINDIALGIPAIIGRKGVEKIWEIELNEKEKEALSQSADKLRKFTVTS